MNSVVQFLNRVDLSAAMRLIILLTAPAASLAFQGRSLEFFSLIMLTNLIGGFCGVLLFRFRHAKATCGVIVVREMPARIRVPAESGNALN